MSDTNKELTALLVEARDQLPLAASCWNQDDDRELADRNVQHVLGLIKRINEALSTPHPETPAPLRGEVSDLQMAELFDKYVGDHSSKYPWEKKDFYDFARAVLRVAAPMPKSAVVTDEQISEWALRMFEMDAIDIEIELRRILALAPGLSGWQEISSAPKDGTGILLGFNDEEVGGFVGQGRWHEEDHDGPDNMGHDAGFMDDQYNFFKCARSFGAESYRSAGLQPTHWQPLPAAPGIAPHQPQPEPTSKGKEAVKYVPVDSSLRDANYEHPNDNEPCTPECRKALNARGDDEGQGLDSFWKWGFKAGFNAASQQRETQEAAELKHGTPHSLGGFRGAFIGEHGRTPTEQEIWNGAIASWRDLNPAPQEAAEVTEFNVGRYCLSEDDCIAEGLHFGAYERGVEDAAKAFGRNRRG